MAMMPPENNQDTQLTDEQVIALVQERGLTLPGTEQTFDMTDDQKVAGVIEGMGGFQGAEGLDEAQRVQAQAELEKDTKIALFEAEKTVATNYPEISESQKFEVAKAFLSGDLMGVLKVIDTVKKAETEKDSQQSEKEKDLHVESESTSKGTAKEGAVSSLSDVFGAGGMLSRVKSFGT